MSDYDSCASCGHDRILHDGADTERGIYCVRVGQSRSTGDIIGCPCKGFKEEK